MPNERTLLQNTPGILSALLSPTPLGFGALAANVGASYLAGRDQKKAQRKQDENVAMANLINSFGGRATPSPVTPQAGGATRFLSTIGQALPVIAGLQDQSQQRQRQARMDDLMEQNVQSQVEARDLAGRQRQEALQSNLFQSLGRSGVTPESRVPVTEESLFTNAAPKTTFRPISETAPPLNVLSSLAAGNRSREADNLGIAKTAAEIDLLGARAADLRAPKAVPEVSLNDQLAQFSPIVNEFAAAGKPFADFQAANPTLPAQALDVLRASYDTRTREIMQAEDADLHDLLYKDVASKLNQNSFMKSAPQVGQAFTLVTKGYAQANGVGDQQMVTGMVRMGEPGLAVRPAESEAIAETAPWLERIGVITSGEKFLEGDKFTDTVRNKLLKLSEETYKTQADLVNRQLDQDMSAIRARVIEVTPRMAAEARNLRMDQFEDTYRLPPTSVYGYTRRPDSAPPDTQPSGALGTLDSILQSIGVSK